MVTHAYRDSTRASEVVCPNPDVTLRLGLGGLNRFPSVTWTVMGNKSDWFNNSPSEATPTANTPALAASPGNSSQTSHSPF